MSNLVVEEMVQLIQVVELLSIALHVVVPFQHLLFVNLLEVSDSLVLMRQILSLTCQALIAYDLTLAC
jgi:hypothetical protein